MSDARTIRVDPRDLRLDKRLARRIWLITAPYWTDPRHWKSWVFLLFGIAVSPAWAYYNFWIATVTAKQATLLVAKNEPEWLAIFWLLFFLAIGKWIYDLFEVFLRQLMTIDWYRWLTRWMTEKYTSERTYYDIAMKEDIDNPDERIQDSLDSFVNSFIDIPLSLIGTLFSIVTSSALLAMANTKMTWFVVGYCGIALVVQTVIYWPLIRLNFVNVAASADLRFGLLRVRDNAETIAFFRGEAMERRQVGERIDRLVKSKMQLYYYGVVMQAVLEALDRVWVLAPLFFVYPLYFSGQIEFGTIALMTGAALTLKSALSNLNNYIPRLAGVAPRVVRLAQIVERHDALAAAAAQSDGHIVLRHGDAIDLQSVSFETPGGEQRLAQNVSLRLSQGQSLVITGQTGVGKSSILRSMAGLWTRGSGIMEMPAQADTMFVPQKPYMMLGDLRAQLLYPHGPDLTDAELQAVMEQVCLPDMIARFGGLSAEIDFGKVLSLGEQQRISFARVLISRPRFVLLDEATSAVDVPTEAKLYQALADSGVTFVSVGHRETILQFHERALVLEVGGGWQLVDAATIPVAPTEQLGAARRLSRNEQD